MTTDLGAWRAVLQDVADRHLADGEIVGAVLGLRDVGGGTVVVPVGTQTIDAASPPVDPTIPWGIGSITKTFVAVVVLQLAEEGRLDLDAGIDGYVPTLADAALITPRELLQHTSGLNEYINSAEVLNGGARTWTVGELVGIAERAGRVGEPGEMHSYANTNYLLLGEIIEQVTGRPWFDAVKERIVEPLGLTGTSVISSDSAPGYASVDGQWVDQSGGWDPSVGGAAGALQSTAGDLLTFGRALADGVLLDAESAAAMQTFIPADDLSAYGVDHGYGLGLERYAGAEVTTFGHLGVGQTQSAFFGYDVDSGTAVVVLMNTTVPGPQAVMAVEALTAISPLD